MTTYSLTMKAIEIGTDGSKVGHLWISVVENGASVPAQSYGFYPGGMHYDDDALHPNPDFQRTWVISEAQYANLIAVVGEYERGKGYRMPWEVCIDFAVAASRAAEVDIRANGDGPLFPGNIEEWLNERYLPGIFDLELGLDPATATLFAQATTAAPARRDPLTLDLDGDGLETTGIDPAAPILFDHDGDGIKTATGWVRPDDGFLVLDRNGNGSIDTGAELFGDATPLYAGGLAADGFAALAQEDTNHDGRVDNRDARFAQLRLWQDRNQDGISQADELSTLAARNIAALLVAKTEHAALLPNGNQIADLGGYLRSDGSSGALGETDTLADIDLASNPFYSEFADRIPATETTASLPDMKGAGQVRNLRDAASLDTDAGRALAAELAAYAGETTRAGQLARLDGLIAAWAATSTLTTSAQRNGHGVILAIEGQTAGSAGYQQWSDKLGVLERFNGQTFVPVPASGSVPVELYAVRQTLLTQSYQSLKDAVYAGLVLHTRLIPYLDGIVLNVADTGITLDYAGLSAQLNARRESDPVAAAQDALELQRYAGANLPGWNGLTQIGTWLGEAGMGAALQATLVACSEAAANESRWWRDGEQRYAGARA